MKSFKIPSNTIMKSIKLKGVLPRRVIQIGTLFTGGFLYYNRENFIGKIDDIFGRYFQYYNEKNTQLSKLVRDNLEIPIEVCYI
jgi:hypothetical protein